MYQQSGRGSETQNQVLADPARQEAAEKSLQIPSRACFGAIVWGEWLLVAFLVGLFLWRGLIPGWRSLNTDFPNYYLTARLYRLGYPLDRVYDWVWFQRQKDHAGLGQQVVGYIPLTLLSGMPMVPLAYLPPLTAKRIWLVFNLFLLALTIRLLCLVTKLSSRRVFLLSLLAVEPLRTSFLYGQGHILVLFLLTLALWLKLRNQPVASGLALAVASALKIYPALFLCYFLRKKQWRSAAGLFFGGIILATLSLYLFGYEANRVYFQDVLPRIGYGENIDPYNINWNSATALLHRLFILEPELNPHPLFNSPAMYMLLQPLVQALLFVPFFWLLTPQLGDALIESLEWGAFAVLLLVLSTSPASYHYCILILSATMIVNYLATSGRRNASRIVIVLYTISCLPLQRFVSSFSDGTKVFLAFPRLYGMLALLGLSLYALASLPACTPRLDSRPTLVFSLILVFLTTMGFLKTRKHLHGQNENYATRQVISRGSLLAGEPCVGQNELLYTNLRRDSYVIAAITGAKVSYSEHGLDTFHPACAGGVPAAFAEVAGIQSRIVPLDMGTAATLRLRAHTEAEDAEQPTLSQDGRYLAFIREEVGRGSLFLKTLEPAGSDTFRDNQGQKLVGSQFDVLDAAFEPSTHNIVFSARPQGKPQLFSVEISTRKIETLEFGYAVRYPAFSPDGQWLAFSRRSQGNWQLWLRHILSSREQRLTDADCNSIAPAWLSDSKTVIYATDCGRGLGLTALSAIRLTQYLSNARAFKPRG